MSYTGNYLNDPDAVNTSNVTINRLTAEGEGDFASEYPCIITRIAPAVVSGTAIITIPDDVLSIRRITYRGMKLDPLPHRQFRDCFQNSTQEGKPFWYIFNNVAQNTLQLFPTPNENIAASTSNLYGSEIPNRLIIEYWQATNPTNVFIPSYFRRRLLKSYALYGALHREGQQQNLKASKYYKQRYETLKKQYGLLLNDLHNKPRKLVIVGGTPHYPYPGYPVLPIDRFGISVDIGE